MGSNWFGIKLSIESYKVRSLEWANRRAGQAGEILSGYSFLKCTKGLTEAESHFSISREMGRGVKMKIPGRPTGWRGVMNQRPQPSDFGLSQLADNVDSITQRQRVRVSRIRHGIGGGMRLSDEADVLRTTGSHFSAEYMGRRLSLTKSRVVLGIYAGGLVAVLLLGHIHLRFKIHDMNMQQYALQTVHRQLQRQATFLDGQMTPLRDPGRLRHFASSQNMVQNDRPDEVKIQDHLKLKYSPEQIAADREKARQREMALQQGTPGSQFRQLSQLAWAFASNQ